MKCSPAKGMGKLLSKIMFRLKETKIVMLGLDAAGKSTILYRMKMKKTTDTLPTVGFNVENFRFKDVMFTVWDVGGQSQIRPLWRHYYTGTQALIFVLDSSDRDRIDEARTELMRILNDRELSKSVVLVFANKQDMPDAMSPAEIQEKLGLTKIRDKNWFIQPSCAKTGEGLVEGLTWITDNVLRMRYR